jgi:PBSX family phage portal protein
MTEIMTSTAPKKGRMFSVDRPGMSNRRRYHPTTIGWNGQYWEPRFSLSWLDQLITSVPYLGSALSVKRNFLVSSCKLKNPKILNRQTLYRYIEDVLSFGHGFLEPETNRRGELMGLHHQMSMWTRRGEKENDYWWVDNLFNQPAQPFGVDLWQCNNYDRRQEIYGIPDYVSALHSALLNQAATVFRVEFSENKGLVRFILHVTADLEEEVMDSIEQKFKSTRGFSIEDMLIHDPDGKPDGVKLIPIMGDISKDDFLNVNKISKDAICIATRVPQQLLAAMPENANGFGNALQAAQVFIASEISPLYTLVIDPIVEEFGDLVEFEPSPILMAQIAHNTTPAVK